MTWIERYYGDDFKKFSPSIIEEGKVWALVKLNLPATKGTGQIGYVLIKKGGVHVSSDYIPLQEGVASRDQVSNMLRALAAKERE